MARKTVPIKSRTMLTEHFAVEEFLCPCCGAKPPDGLEFLTLASALEGVRLIVGKPIRVLSGHRCAAQNGRDGHAKASRHLTVAADVTSKAGWRRIYEAALRIPAFAEGGIGIYPHNNFVHLDVRGHRRWARIHTPEGKNEYVSLEAGLEAANEHA